MRSTVVKQMLEGAQPLRFFEIPLQLWEPLLQLCPLPCCPLPACDGPAVPLSLHAHCPDVSASIPDIKHGNHPQR
jgi:hypothetical protein